MTEDNDPTRPYLSPQDVEREVKRHFDEAGGGLSQYSSSLRELIPGMDGEYESDVVASFLALGVRMRVLIECKHHRRPVARDVIALLVHNSRAQAPRRALWFQPRASSRAPWKSPRSMGSRSCTCGQPGSLSCGRGSTPQPRRCRPIDWSQLSRQPLSLGWPNKHGHRAAEQRVGTDKAGWCAPPSRGSR